MGRPDRTAIFEDGANYMKNSVRREETIEMSKNEAMNFMRLGTDI